MQPFSAVYSEGRVVVPAQNEADTLVQDGFGVIQNHVLVLKPIEVLYHVERNKIQVTDETTNQHLSFQNLLGRFSETNPAIWTRFIVYRNLRTRGLITVNGKDNESLQVYERSSYKKQPPAYRVIIISEGSPKQVPELISQIRETEKNNQEVKIAAVDRRGEIVFYGVTEKKFKELG